jgi:hypothetical protein
MLLVSSARQNNHVTHVKYFIRNLGIFHLISSTDIDSISELTMILKIIYL